MTKTASTQPAPPAGTAAGDNTVYLVDGSGFIFRAYHALPPLNRPDGTPVGAVYGFTNMLIKLLADMQAHSMAVIFDAKRKNFRNDIYPEYKANRPETPEDLVPQFEIIRDATRAFNLPCIELEGYEADDLIATYARLAVERGKRAVIVSSDKDLMQLVRPGVEMFDPLKSEFMGEEAVIKKFGVPPEKVADVQALAGDSTDNVPGVPGIGLKTAAQLIEEYGDLETLLARAGEIKQNKRRETLIENAELARISKKLVSLDDRVDVPMPLEQLSLHEPDHRALLDFLKTQGFRTTITRLEKKFASDGVIEQDNPQAGADSKPEKGDRSAAYEMILDEAALGRWIAKITERGFCAIDTETTDLTPAKARLVGISISTGAGEACYIPLTHGETDTPDGQLDFSTPAKDSRDPRLAQQLPTRKVMALLQPMLEDASVLKIGHNIKFDMQMFLPFGIRIAPVDDTMLLSYVLDGSSHGHGMDELAQLFLNHKTVTYAEITGSGKTQIGFADVPLDTALHYAAEDADVTLRLHGVLKPRLAAEHMATPYELVERPVIPVIAAMEYNGVKVDPEVLHRMSAEFGKKLEQLEKNIFALAGQSFNVASPKQLGDVLFGALGLEGGKKTKTGGWSTSVDVLEELAAQGHEIADRVLDWRQVSKLKSTYTDALPHAINPKTGRVHTSFSMAGTNTGRLSSSDPNLQNIPIRTEDGRKIRSAFVAEDGYLLLSVDYSQVELRLLAELADIKALHEAFANGIDIHAHTASQVFGVPLKDMTPDLRRQAKAINFGIIYGISAFGLAKQLGCPQGVAADYIRKYLARFPELTAYMDRCKEFARKNGYVLTLYGRKCYIPDINDKNPARRGFGERQAINAPLQGTAADIMKCAMAQMPAALERAGLRARLLLQVHDELLLEVPEREIEETARLVTKVMEETGQKRCKVPLLAEAGHARNWADAH